MLRNLLLVLGLLALLDLAACGRDPLVSKESYVFGTRVQVLVWGEAEARADAAVNAVLREFDRLHRTYHAWQPSELTVLNDAFAKGQSLAVSEEMAGFVQEARDIAVKGEFLFDPGIGKLVALWGFHDDTFKPRLPDPARLKALQAAHPSVADVQIASCGHAPSASPARGAEGWCISSRNRALALDFGGYLKGVALDRAAAILRQQGVHNALINIGGNIMALGSKGGTPWRVGLQHPRSTSPLAALELRDGEAIGTSGDYQRYFELNGRRYSHLIDPRTGEPTTVSESVSVLIPPGPKAGMWSDAASKPLFIAGDDWPRLAARLGIAYALRVAGDGRVQVTSAFQARLRFDPADLAVTVVTLPRS